MKPVAYLWVVTMFFLASISQAAPVDSSFTYQGALQHLGVDADGVYDFRFELFDQLSDGSTVGSPVEIENISVSGGVFSVELDFGPAVFDGTQLWLEISVREGSSMSAHTGLDPRQKVTNAPFALHAQSVTDNSIDSAAIDSDQVQQRVEGTCPLGYYLLGINADGSVQCEDVPGVPSLSTLDDSGNDYAYTSIAIGSDGRPIISYYDETADNLKTAYCLNTACTSAFIQTPAVTGGEYNSITIGTDGLPIISYYEAGTSDLKVAHCDDIQCISSTITYVDSSGPDDVGHWTDIAIGSDGFPVISYQDVGNADLKVVHCTNVTCTTSTKRTVVSSVPFGTSDIGYYTSIAIAPNGFPVISFYDQGAGNLVLVRCLELDCSNFSQGIVDSVDDVGSHTSIAVGADGLPIISYNDVTNGALKVLHCTVTNCTSQTKTILDTFFSTWTSIAIGTDGNPVISYYRPGTGDLYLVNCENASCTESSSTPLDSPGVYTSIAIGADGQPVISYVGFGPADLKVIKCGGGCK